MKLSLAIACFACRPVISAADEPTKHTEDFVREIKIYVRSLDGDAAHLNASDQQSANHVMMYLSGYRDLACLMSQDRHHSTAAFLIPNNTLRIEQFVRIVDKYIADHPEELNLPPGMLVWNALIHAFPNPDSPPDEP